MDVEQQSSMFSSPQEVSIRENLLRRLGPHSLVPSQPHSIPSELDEAFNYLNLVKEHFANQPDVYDRFLHILRNYRTGV